jgi:hypothetical protein
MLEREIETYKQKLPKLLVHEGKFVLIKNEKVIAIVDTYGEALQIGYTRFPAGPFLVKQIQAVEPVRVYFLDVKSGVLSAPAPRAGKSKCATALERRRVVAASEDPRAPSITPSPDG